MNTKIIIANWKSNKSLEQVKSWLQDFKDKRQEIRDKNIVIAPAMSLLSLVRQEIEGLPIDLAVQDLSPFPPGKYTGAVCAQNLEGFNVKYAILGHSERRRYFHETHVDVANKVERCLEANIQPIVCVDDDYIVAQAAAIKSEYLEKCIVAYEALESIGTGHGQPIENVAKVFEQIREVFGNIRLFYGGSVDGSNIHDYLNISDGVLVGTASLEVEDFISLLETRD